MWMVMVNQRAAQQQPVRIDYVRHGLGRIELRLFDPARDSFDALTTMLHRAFERLGAMGLNCTCVDQSAAVTRSRATRGYAELALDTPQPAAHLVAFYRGHGFRIVGFLRFDGKRYDSAILAKPAVAARRLGSWSQRLELPRRQIACAV
jgi:hypothetical protein